MKGKKSLAKIPYVCDTKRGGCGKEIMYVLEYRENPTVKMAIRFTNQKFFQLAIHKEEFDPAIHTVIERVNRNTIYKYGNRLIEKCAARAEREAYAN